MTAEAAETESLAYIICLHSYGLLDNFGEKIPPKGQIKTNHPFKLELETEHMQYKQGCWRTGLVVVSEFELALCNLLQTMAGQPYHASH